MDFLLDQIEIFWLPRGAGVSLNGCSMESDSVSSSSASDRSDSDNDNGNDGPDLSDASRDALSGNDDVSDRDDEPDTEPDAPDPATANNGVAADDGAEDDDAAAEADVEVSAPVATGHPGGPETSEEPDIADEPPTAPAVDPTVAANDNLETVADAVPEDPQAVAASIAAAHSYSYQQGMLAETAVTDYDTAAMASDVLNIAHSDPVAAMDVAAALAEQMPAAYADAMLEQVAERVETSRLAEFNLDVRNLDDPREVIDPEAAQAAADAVLSESYRAGLRETVFGGQGPLDADAIVEGLLEMRDINQDLAVAARQEVMGRVTPEMAEQIDAALAEAPPPEGVAVLSANTNPWSANAVTRFAGSLLGDPVAVIGSAFRNDGLAVNPLTNEILDGRRLEDARFGTFVDVATLGLGKGLTTTTRAGAAVIDEVAATTRAAPAPASGMLPTEGVVGSYDDLIAAGTKGDNITPHHVPSANRMADEGVAKGDGIAINMEHPHPGAGGRHRDTFTYGTQADANMTPREALAAGVRDLRDIYQREGLYNDFMRGSLQDLIAQNKVAHPEVFR